jgi:hypothetical protein
MRPSALDLAHLVSLEFEIPLGAAELLLAFSHQPMCRIQALLPDGAFNG